MLPICAYRDKSISARPDKKRTARTAPPTGGFRSRTRPLVFHGPGTRTTGTSGRNATSTSAVTAMPNAHFTSSPITSHPSARTCRSAHMRPRSLPRISRSQHPPPLMARARSLYTPSTRAAAASLVLQSASPDSSSQLVTDQIGGGSAPRPPRCSRRPRPTPWATWTSPASTTSACAPRMCRSAPTASSSAAAASYRCSRAGSSPSG